MCAKLFLKLIKVGGAVSGDVGLNELDEANYKCPHHVA